MKYLTKCNKRGQGPQMGELVCMTCGKKFKERLTMIKYKERNNIKSYCSNKCFQQDRKDRIPDMFCIVCNKKITNHQGHKRKFCSRTCYDIWQKDQEKRQCVWCGKIFETQTNATQRYCCKRCALSSTGETGIEKLFREELEKRKISFKQYEKIDSFFVDFLLPNKVVIECDGIHWHSMPEVIERDKRKNKLLKEEGYKLFRFTDKEINQDVEKCVDMVI